MISVTGKAGDNLYPPGPIRDLKVTDIINAETFNLTFTSPGEDLNTGTVKEYKIFFATNRTDLDDLSPSSNVVFVTEDMLQCNCSLSPVPALEMVNLRLNSSVFEANTEVSFRVLAVDKGKKTSASNIVTLAPSFQVPSGGVIFGVNLLMMSFVFIVKLQI